MTSENDKTKTSMVARFKKVLAGLALAGTLVAGVGAVADVDPISSEDTTEEAWGLLKIDDGPRDPRMFSRGVSWH